MAGAAAHQTDEVPVFLCGVGVALDVADQLAVNLAGGVETKRGFDHFVLQVAVDGLRAADNLNAAVLLQVVLSEYAGVGVRVVTTDDHNRFDAELLAHLDTVVELPGLFEFRTPRTDDIKTAGVTVLVDDIFRQLLVLALDQARRTTKETVELVSRIEFLQSVKQSADHVMPAGSLAAGEDHTYVDGRLRFRSFVARLHRDNRQAVGVREELLDLVLISYTLRCGAFRQAHIAGQSYRHLRLITASGNL